MLLAIDVGNTNMTCGIWDDDTLLGTFRLRSNRDTTSDEIGALAVAGCGRFGVAPEKITAVYIDSVVPQIMRALKKACLDWFGCRPVVVDEDIDTGLKYGVALGVEHEYAAPDRSVTAIAALKKYGAPLILLDLGTATTVDAFDAEGRYLGGSIGAGLGMTLNALTAGTAMLPSVPLQMPAHIIGQSTTEQLQAGVVAAYAGGLDYLIRDMQRTLGGSAVVVATGGFAGIIAEALPVIKYTDADLTLEGLKLLWQRSGGEADR